MGKKTKNKSKLNLSKDDKARNKAARNMDEYFRTEIPRREGATTSNHVLAPTHDACRHCVFNINTNDTNNNSLMGSLRQAVKQYLWAKLQSNYEEMFGLVTKWANLDSSNEQQQQQQGENRNFTMIPQAFLGLAVDVYLEYDFHECRNQLLDLLLGYESLQSLLAFRQHSSTCSCETCSTVGSQPVDRTTLQIIAVKGNARIYGKVESELDFVRYLSKKIPCRCLDRAKRRLKTEPKVAPCMNCRRLVEKQALLDCSRCMAARYCSPRCQKEAWEKHKLNCKVFSTMHRSGSG